MDWNNKNVFITGGDGFIGSWLAKKLCEKKTKVVILVRDVRLNAPYKALGLEDKVTQVFGDLTDYRFIERVLKEYNIDTCFHLAAQALVQIANRGPISTFKSNIEGTWSILEACRNVSGLERIVVASSDKAYGSQKDLPYTEKSPLLGRYPYDASKACADILAQSYFISFGLPVAITRNANTYGPGDLNFSRVIPDVIRCVLSGKEFVVRSDGTPERDYLYVEDAVSGYIRVAEELNSKKVKGEAFNFGTAKPINVIELFKKIARLCSKPKSKLSMLGIAKNEIDRQYLAIGKAGKVLNWQPRYSLDEGLKFTIAWYKKYLKIK